MKKIAFILAALVFSSAAFSEIVYTTQGTITKLYAYDDHGSIEGKEGAAIYIYLNTGLAACPNSIYLSPNSPGYNNLVSFTLTAFISQRTVSFQVYDDASRKLSGRCEVDAIRFE
jgi:hypothetical protein